MEERIIELFREGLVKGTVTISIGNEATSVGMAMPFRPGQDVVSFLQRDFGAHLAAGMTPYSLICQYMANADSPTFGLEGNVHHGDAGLRRFPMISHLGNMLATVVGGVYAARRNGEDVYGLAAIGDGGTSTGDCHESLNFASVRKIPVVFLVENNRYAFSTPTRLQYNCEKLSDRAAGYGVRGVSIDGTDAWEVYSTVINAIDEMRIDHLPWVVECRSVRLKGHAVYDKAEYVSAEERAIIEAQDPLPKARAGLHEISGMDEADIIELERSIDEEIEETIAKATRAARPSPQSLPWKVHAEPVVHRVDPFKARKAKNFNAVTMALDYLLEREPRAFLLGQDIGPYGSAFKTCKGLFEKFGGDRVIDTPICESATTGFGLGASQTGGRPIIEYQFADFSTEAATQLGLNCGTWFYRAHQPAPVLFRLPCGAGVTLGAFHSAEFDGIWSRFPGLKLLYPFTTQETFEALVAGFYDPNPCIVFEHKFLYVGQGGDIDFSGDLDAVWRPRRYAEGTDVTVVAWGAMLKHALTLAQEGPWSLDVWNPFVLAPLDVSPIAESVARTGRLVIVHEAGETAGLGSCISHRLTAACFDELTCAPRLVTAPDCPVPFAPELEKFYIPSLERVRETIASMMGDRS